MARFLIVGGGQRALALARELSAEGHAPRMTTRDPSRQAEIEAAGGECVIADPDRIGTLRYALDNVTILMWLLGNVNREPLHGSRWKMMLERTIDTTVRGVLYERGTDAGEALTRQMAEYNGIPYAILDAATDPWVPAAHAAIEDLLK
jgi:UDP:flavonoid glycosyltransferase YjiC (YdhE family)